MWWRFDMWRVSAHLVCTCCSYCSNSCCYCILHNKETPSLIHGKSPNTLHFPPQQLSINQGKSSTTNHVWADWGPRLPQLPMVYRLACCMLCHTSTFTCPTTGMFALLHKFVGGRSMAIQKYLERSKTCLVGNQQHTHQSPWTTIFCSRSSV